MKVDQPAFKPAGAGSVNVAAGTVSANVQVQSGQNARHIRVANSGSVTVFVEFGTTNSTAASLTTSVPVLAGSVEIFSAPYEYAAAITASGTATVYFTPGEGM
jgi:hypothetical protein